MLVRILAGFLLTLTASATASTVSPRSGAWYGETVPSGGKDANAAFVVKGQRMLPQTITASWSGIMAPTSFKCNEGYLQLRVRRLLIVRGRFSYQGLAVDTVGGKSTGIRGRLTWTGHFLSPTTVSGKVRFQAKVTPIFHNDTYRYTLAPKACDTGTLRWEGKLP